MLRLDAELNKDIIIELKKPLGTLYPDFEDAIDEKDADYILSYFVNLWGEEETYDWLKDAVDTDKVADGVIDWDGRGHILAAYDGEEIELADNDEIEYYAYRIN